MAMQKGEAQQEGLRTSNIYSMTRQWEAMFFQGQSLQPGLFTDERSEQRDVDMRYMK